MTENQPIVVRMEHLRQLRYCSRGVRAFFARYGLDYSRFLSEGIEASVLLEASNHDEMAVAAVEVASGKRR